MFYRQQKVLKKPSSMISLFYNLLIISTLLRILLFLDVGIDYSLTAYTLILFLATMPYFSAACIMIYIWFCLYRLDIYLLTRWDIDISKRFRFISLFKIIQVVVNLLIWIAFSLLAICSALNLYSIEGLSRGITLLEAGLSFLILLGLTLAGVSLGRRVRNLVNHMPGRLVPWLFLSILFTAYRFISQLLVLFSQNLWGFIDKSSLWYLPNRSIFLIVDVNCGEIIPIITFLFSCKSCIGFIRSTHSTVDSSETNSMDHFKMLYR